MGLLAGGDDTSGSDLIHKRGGRRERGLTTKIRRRCRHQMMSNVSPCLAGGDQSEPAMSPAAPVPWAEGDGVSITRPYARVTTRSALPAQRGLRR